MNAQALLPVDTDTLLALVGHLRESDSGVSLAEAAALAIRAWLADGARTRRPADTLAARASQTAPGAIPGSRGYQWKELFLPDGTEVRMRCDGEVHHASVSGDSIVYKGHAVSPRQFTLVVAGNGRNAWRDLSLRLPGEKHFQPAALLRHRVRNAVKPGLAAPPESPAAAMAAAAEAMSGALRCALELVEHSNAIVVPKYERRNEHHRRAADKLADYAALD